MRVLVTYYSKGGHTKALARSVAGGVQEVEDVDCVLTPVADVLGEDVLEANGIIAGSPVYFDTMASEVTRTVSYRVSPCSVTGSWTTTSTFPSPYSTPFWYRP